VDALNARLAAIEGSLWWRIRPGRLLRRSPDGPPGRGRTPEGPDG
jgi:hypothetical protein